MTQEKQLLFKDLCARFPYGIICKLSAKDADVSITEKLEIGGLEHFISGTMDALPYLRSMSSMTVEEEDEYQKCGFDDIAESGEILVPSHRMDFLNSHHFDYHGLIEKGLALEAPEGMYKTD